jgi:pyruvate/2-oxoglutarate dehydrogenase complex dihydrolipoamide dehydrogenase (E3) component
MATTKQILVIGGGPAGIQAALAAASEGCRVILVSDGPPGGRAVWQTLLPSKIWLEAERNFPDRSVSELRKGFPGLVDRLRARYEEVAWSWQRQLAEDLERAGVELKLGTASFLSQYEIQVVPPEGGYPDQIPVECVIIATGAVPFIPPGLKPDGERVFSPNLIWQMKELPESMIMIGAGGPATEYVDAFSRLGTTITWITGPVGVLSAFPPEARRVMTKVMEKRGVKILTGLMAHQIERYEDGIKVSTGNGLAHSARAGFIAIGLRPDFERLNLAAAGLRAGTSGGLAVDAFGRTAVPHIYLVGDASSPLSANISMAQGRVIGRHAAGKAVDPLRDELAVMAIYTDPQVAVVGRLNDRMETLQKIRVPFRACLRAHLMAEPDEILDLQFLEIAYDSQRRVRGALAVCSGAAEMLTPVAIAIRAGLTIDVLATVTPAHPTFSEFAIQAARMIK